MKKYLSILFVAIFALAVTGCGGKKETVKCSMSQTQTGMEMASNLTVGINNSEFDYLDMTISVTIDDTYLSYKDLLVSSIESEFESFEDTYGAKVKINETSKGVDVNITMDKEEAEKFYGKESKKITKKDVIDTFEDQGYTCK